MPRNRRGQFTAEEHTGGSVRSIENAVSCILERHFSIVDDVLVVMMPNFTHGYDMHAVSMDSPEGMSIRSTLEKNV